MGYHFTGSLNPGPTKSNQTSLYSTKLFFIFPIEKELPPESNVLQKEDEDFETSSNPSNIPMSDESIKAQQDAGQSSQNNPQEKINKPSKEKETIPESNIALNEKEDEVIREKSDAQEALVSPDGPKPPKRAQKGSTLRAFRMSSRSRSNSPNVSNLAINNPEGEVKDSEEDKEIHPESIAEPSSGPSDAHRGMSIF